MRSRIKTAATVVALLTAGLLAGAPNTLAATSGDPLATGCANTARTVWRTDYLGAGTVEIRYSDGCGTNWIRVSGATGRPSEAGIWSAASGWQWSPSYLHSPSQYWTNMAYAPGSNCVIFRAKIIDVNGYLVDTGEKTLC